MPTFKPVIFLHQLRKDGTLNIKIRVTHLGVPKYIDTGITVSKSDITKTGNVKDKSLLDYANEMIKTYREACNKEALKVKSMSPEHLISFLTKSQQPQSLDFIHFSENYIKSLENEGKTGTAKNYNTTINKLKKYTKRDALSVLEINKQFLKEFEKYILDEFIKETGEAPKRARSLYLTCLRSLFNKMKDDYNDEDSGIILIPHYPFKNYKMPSEPLPQKRALSVSLIQQILSIDYKADAVRFNLAKDCYMLSFCLLGINTIDLYACTDLKDWVLTYKRQKVKNRRKDEALISIEVTEITRPLFEKYKDETGKRVFNFYHLYANAENFNKAVNIGLKQIADKLGIDKFDYYSARHSLATIAINECGINKNVVHEMLNHVDEDMKITDIYVKKDWSVINNANRVVLDYIFDPLFF